MNDGYEEELDKFDCDIYGPTTFIIVDEINQLVDLVLKLQAHDCVVDDLTFSISTYVLENGGATQHTIDVFRALILKDIFQTINRKRKIE